MIVSSQHRRRGVGRILTETLLVHARKHDLLAVWLATTEPQWTARVMYEKYGWVEVFREQLKAGWGLIAVELIWYKLELAQT
jgi:ribosomal protein S18 acetylase RimI-like enzyme